MRGRSAQPERLQAQVLRLQPRAQESASPLCQFNEAGRAVEGTASKLALSKLLGVSPMRGVRAEPEPKLGQPPSYNELFNLF